MDYQRMSDNELLSLLKQRLPGLPFNEVDDDNRETVKAYLKLYQDFQATSWFQVGEMPER